MYVTNPYLHSVYIFGRMQIKFNSFLLIFVGTSRCYLLLANIFGQIQIKLNFSSYFRGYVSLLLPFNINFRTNSNKTYFFLRIFVSTSHCYLLLAYIFGQTQIKLNFSAYFRVYVSLLLAFGIHFRTNSNKT
jgi:hypothetical protein